MIITDNKKTNNDITDDALHQENMVCIVKQAEKNLGIFILATNDCSEHLDMQTMLDHYKSQQKVGGGFRFLKSPDFLVALLFLKKPERIEALLMVMTC